MIVSDQIRAARALLKWSAQDLARESGVAYSTIRRMEAADGIPSASAKNVAAVQGALEQAGVEFIPQDGGGPGVRLRDRSKATLIVPKFEVRQPKDGSGWYVAVMWPNGPEQQIHFASEAEATKWITKDAPAWVAQHRRSKRGS